MSDFTTYTEEAIRDWMSQGSAMPSAPSSLHVALHTADPGGSPDGSTEVSASDYSRQSVSAGSGWSTTGSGEPSGFENASEVNFGESTSNWGTITHVSLWDGSTATDNCLAAYALDAGSEGEVTSGVEVLFPAGDLSFNID